MRLDLSKVCGPDCIAAVILNCETELSYIKHELFNGHVHEYQPLFEGMVVKLTVANNLSIIFNSEQNSGNILSVFFDKFPINLQSMQRYCQMFQERK